MKALYLLFLLSLSTHFATAQCTLSFTNLAAQACNDNATPSDEFDDTFSTQVDVSATNGGTSFVVSYTDATGTPVTSDPVNYGSGGYLATNLPATGNPIEITVLDFDGIVNPACFTVGEVLQASCSGQCDLTILQTTIGLCDDNGTGTDLTDDFFSVTLNVGNSGSASNQYVVENSAGNDLGTYTYLDEITIGDFPAAGIVIDLTIRDVDDPSCSTQVSLSQDPCSFDCAMSVVINESTPCYDNNTSGDSSDDTFVVGVELEASNGSSTFTISTQPDIYNGTGIYNEFEFLPLEFPANGSDIVITFTDTADPNCSNSITVNQPSCSTECLLDISATPYPCDNNNTPSDPTDDFFGVDIFVNPENGSGSTTFRASNLTVGTEYGFLSYGVTEFLGNIPANGLAQTFRFQDGLDPNCETFVEFSSDSCSDVCEMIIADLAESPCNNNSTDSDSSDDTFDVSFNLAGFNIGTTYNLSVSTGESLAGLPYGIDQSITLPANGTDIVLTFVDANDPTCMVMATVGQNSCSSTCVMTIDALPNACDDNGTPSDNTDDFFFVDVTVTANNGGGTSFDITGDGISELGVLYGITATFGPLPADGTDHIILFTNTTDPVCNNSIAFSQTSCSDECAVDAIATPSLCDDNGTSTDPTDDTFSAVINVMGMNGNGIGALIVYTDATGTTLGLGPVPYGVSSTVPNLAANGLPVDITISDFNGGPSPTCFTIIQVSQDDCSDACFFVEPSINHTSLCSNCDGAIDLQVTGGVGGYTFDWADLSGTDDPEDRVDLCPGSYSVIVTDANACSESLDFVIACPPAIENITVTDVSCWESCDGAIDLTVSGNAPFSYLWANVSTTEDVTGLCAGTYTVTITDNLGLTTTGSYVIDTASELIVNITASPQSCNDDGTAEAIVAGGDGNYTYFWDAPGNPTTNIITDLPAGTYSVTVVDENDCTASESIYINPPFDLITSSTETNCDDIGGTATITIFGTVNNPVFSWSNGATESVATDLATGWYSVTVTDPETTCFAHENIEVAQDPTCYVLISGYVFNDNALQTCNDNGSLAGVGNIMLFLDNGDLTFSDANGYFEFLVEPGSYTVSLILNTLQYLSVCTDPITIDLPEGGTESNNNSFFLKHSTQSDLVVKVVKGPARPGFEQYVRVCAMNYGDGPMNGTVSMHHDPLQTFNYASPAESSYNASEQLIEWNFTNLNPGQVFVYHAYLDLPANVAIGTFLTFDFVINPVVGDINPEDNYEECISTVTGSYDPNDKSVSPMGVGDEGFIFPQDSVLNYTIRFQNTGNDTAFTVVLRDTIDPALDMLSVVPLASEHPYTLDVLDGHVLEFTFKDIMLPDSTTNEPESHGFIIYKIKLNNDLPLGTTIENRAGIYFDYNAPIITNTTLNTLVTDPVWPGDADQDSIVSQYDLLHLGIGFGSAGPLRPDASLSWQEAPCLDWPQVTPESSVNYKHIDTDGNGLIDAFDVEALGINWGETITPAIEFPIFYPQLEIDRELYIELEATTEGATVSVPVMLGTETFPVTDVHGLAFKINYDTSLIEPGSMHLVFEDSWLGNISNNMISFQKDIYDEAYIAVALTRTDGMSQDGFGQIARLNFIIQDDILLNQNQNQFAATATEVDLVFVIESVKMIDEQERLLSLKYGSTSAPVMTSVSQVMESDEIIIYPNPSSSFIKIATKNLPIDNVRLYNVTGNLIYHENYRTNKISLNTEMLNAGTYLIEISTSQGVWRDKILIMR